MTLPKDFKDLDAKELYRSAIADFALPVEEEDAKSKKVLLAAFVEGGVEWSDYVAQHPEVAGDPVETVESIVPSREPEASRPGEVITLGDKPQGLSVEVDAPVVRVKEEVKIDPTDKFLIKMERDNPLFEVRGYRFTSENPYALVDAEDAQAILEDEDGFRQAYPKELQEFYG